MVPNRRESRVVLYRNDVEDAKEKRIVERCRVRCREFHDAAMVNCLDEPVSSDFMTTVLLQRWLRFAWVPN